MNKFLAGASTAAHQVEGNNKNSDFWTLENIKHSSFKEPSLEAVDHYHRYKEDIDLLKAAGLNAYRFSIEWARVQPTEDKFDELEMGHYKQVIAYCHSVGVTPVVTLHHFSSPKWLISQGGWEAEQTVDSFKKYVTVVMNHMGSELTHVCTINEANMGIQLTRIIEKFKKRRLEAFEDTKSALSGGQNEAQVGINLKASSQQLSMVEAGEAFGIPPAEVATFLSSRSPKGQKIIMDCHVGAREIIKQAYPEIRVGLSLSLYDYQVLGEDTGYAGKLWSEDFEQFLPHIQNDDFIGVQNYTRKLIEGDGEAEIPKGSVVTEMGNEFYPHSLKNVCSRIAEVWEKELLITENGVSTSDDSLRQEHLKVVFKDIQEGMEAGLNITGYLHWSLLDNFEWQLGYSQKFGLIGVDRSSMKRSPKESLWLLGKLYSDTFVRN